MEKIQAAEQKGKLEGKLEGKQENRQEIALRMLDENIPLETIARITELSISELEGFANDRIKQLRSESVDR